MALTRGWIWIGALISLAAGAPALAQEHREAQELREKLTEREDENRMEHPTTFVVFGRPLMVGGEVAGSIAALRNAGLGQPGRDYDRVLWEQALTAEVFYTFGPQLSLFVQGEVATEYDLDHAVPDRESTVYLKRDEMWLFAGDMAGSGVNAEAGRLDYEDDRLWWWDADLDALRLSWEREDFEIQLSVAQELFSDRTNRTWVEPDQERILRYFAELSWDFLPDHALQLFALRAIDHSPTQVVGDVVPEEREDEEDADEYWLGARLSGAWESRTRGLFGYWGDLGVVHGSADELEFEEGLPGNRSLVTSRRHGRVSGWGFDVGATWLMPLAFEPRASAGWARGSRGYRQTGIQADEIGFGGVQRFQRYGEILAPELANLQVLTAGLGCTVLRSSSLDLVYHYYSLATRETSLRNAGLDPDLTGHSRDLGQEIDLVLALEDWERLEIELIGSLFRPGNAFADDRHSWAYGGLVEVRVAF